MGSDIGIGVWISFLGISLTFLALILLIVYIRLLGRLFPVDDSQSFEAVENMEEGEISEQQIAAIAAAWYWKNHVPEPRSDLGQRLTEPPDSWWQSGIREMQRSDE